LCSRVILLFICSFYYFVIILWNILFIINFQWSELKYFLNSLFLHYKITNTRYVQDKYNYQTHHDKLSYTRKNTKNFQQLSLLQQVLNKENVKVIYHFSIVKFFQIFLIRSVNIFFHSKYKWCMGCNKLVSSFEMIHLVMELHDNEKWFLII